MYALNARRIRLLRVCRAFLLLAGEAQQGDIDCFAFCDCMSFEVLALLDVSNLVSVMHALRAASRFSSYASCS
jgi:hypothetical protein